MTNTMNDRNLGNQAQHTMDQARDTANRVADQAKNMGREALEAGTRPQTQGKEQHREGVLARTIEQQTAKLPSDTFLWAALGSIGTSLVLKAAGKHEGANFVGQWAPTFLILGMYNKMVKLMGSDAR